MQQHWTILYSLSVTEWQYMVVPSEWHQLVFNLKRGGAQFELYSTSGITDNLSKHCYVLSCGKTHKYMLLYESDYKKICVMIRFHPLKRGQLLHACRQLPGHTNDNRQADRVTDIKNRQYLYVIPIYMA